MQNIINIQRREDKNLVSARQLHSSLEIGRDFTTWFKHSIENFGFQEGIDFSPDWGKSTGGRPSKDFALTPEAALCIAARQNNPKSNEVLKSIVAYLQQLREAAAQSAIQEKEYQELISERSRLYREMAPIRKALNQIARRIKQFHGVKFPQLQLFDNPGTTIASANQSFSTI